MEINSSANKAFFTSLSFFLLASLLLFSLFKKIIPLTVNHIVYFCQNRFGNAVVTLPHSLPSLVVTILSLVFLTGILILLFQLFKTKVLIYQLLRNQIPINKPTQTFFESLDMADKVNIVENDQYLSFCYGFIKPKIILSSKLIDALTKDELQAVLIHEQYHLKNRDPLKIVLGHIATSMFWFLPVLKDFHDHFIVLKEFAADQMVINLQGSTKNLKLALVKVVSGSINQSTGAVAFAVSKGLEARILHLAAIGKEPVFKISLIRLFLSCSMLLFFFTFLNMPIYPIEVGKNTHAYLVCPTNSSCGGIASCPKEQTTKENMFSSQPMFSPVKYSSE